MCLKKVELVIDRMQNAITWHVCWAVSLVTVAVAAFISTLFVYSLKIQIDKLQGTLVSVFFAAMAAFPIKEIHARRDKILLLRLVKEDYETLRTNTTLPSGQTVSALEDDCAKILQKVLGA